MPTLLDDINQENQTVNCYIRHANNESYCLACIVHDRGPCKTAEPIEVTFWGEDSIAWVPRNTCYRLRGWCTFAPHSECGGIFFVAATVRAVATITVALSDYFYPTSVYVLGRPIEPWNFLNCATVDFSSLRRFKRFLRRTDLSK